jgi:acetamidase/formamidase
VLEVEPGDSVRFALPNSAWLLAPGEAVDRTDPELDTGHAMVGPLEMRGAVAGQVLSVTIDEVVAGS